MFSLSFLLQLYSSFLVSCLLARQASVELVRALYIIPYGLEEQDTDFIGLSWHNFDSYSNTLMRVLWNAADTTFLSASCFWHNVSLMYKEIVCCHSLFPCCSRGRSVGSEWQSLGDNRRWTFPFTCGRSAGSLFREGWYVLLLRILPKSRSREYI